MVLVAQLTWTLPFGLLDNVFLSLIGLISRSRKLLKIWVQVLTQTFRYVVFPIILPSIIGIALFGFTLSYDELARSSQVMGATNTLPLDLRRLNYYGHYANYLCSWDYNHCCFIFCYRTILGVSNAFNRRKF